jgi:hypothetical protein
MTKLHLPPLALAASFTAALTGCETSDEPSQQDYDDVATAMSSALVSEDEGDIVAMGEVVLLVEGSMPSDMEEDGDVYVGGTATFEYRYAVQCNDASGVAQSACDDATNDARVDIDWTGTLSSSRYDTQIERSGTWSLSNVQSDLVSFTGESSFELDSSFTALYRDVRRNYELSYSASYDAITYDRTTDRFSGSIVYDVQAERMDDRGNRSVEASFDMEANLTFNGDGTATLVLDGAYRYRLDTQTGELTAE